ncbi:conserved hypothetical protein [Verticillium alfalfae VaMs.102]|uniref:DUF2461 domain-containing protein n=1 Tax=Verticillium alfalfae (strain VaMs.102 / ATCC MYA-4576 / FGSC 10136) TaxID=526221 RepID=C9ST83_VERA1|nr:conserved hypothetical protein [Verticillium alfalfae VaMs.102]EEY21998.1 conserved hypothetical protein [Verticillium alfalfae VaMs.102]
MPARKRAAASPPEDEPRRRPRRTTSTPKTSAYFDDESDESADFKADDLSEDEEDEEDEEIEHEPPKRGRGRPPTKTKAKAKSPIVKRNGTKLKKGKKSKEEEEEDVDEYKEKESSEEEDDEDEDDDDDAAPRVTITKLIGLRPLDGVEYADTKLHKNTLAFLQDLRANNTRPWLKSHDGEYRRALTDFNTFIEALTPLVSEADETVPELPLRDLTFRIHRDMRFSKNPTPYKPHFGAAWSRTGRKGPYACYYLHVEPGSAFLGGGLWCPPAEQRMYLEGKGKGKGDEEAVDAFCQGNQENALKTKPKGWEADHRDIGLLKLRSYTVGAKIEDGLFAREDAQERLKDMVVAMEPFVSTRCTLRLYIVFADSPGYLSQSHSHAGPWGYERRRG